MLARVAELCLFPFLSLYYFKRDNNLLAYDENGDIQEFENRSDLDACRFCHRIYRSIETDQIEGFRERDYNTCPYCGHENGSSMSVDFYNSALGEDELRRIPRRSLIKTVISYCDHQYQNSTCIGCNHPNHCPNVVCPSNCKICLEEIHYPSRYPDGKRDYDCDRLMDFYVCDYSFKYASEMLYLMRKSDILKSLNPYHVLSIGCGGCADLMALEKFCHEVSFDKEISYIGIDINGKWKPIHNVINHYRTSTIKNTQFCYYDATSGNVCVTGINVIILQYVVSTLFKKGGPNTALDQLFDNLIKYIIVSSSRPCVVLINDVNSINTGRNYCDNIISKCESKGIHARVEKFFFDSGGLNDYQRFGMTAHGSRDILFRDILDSIPDNRRFNSTYQPWQYCSGFQMLLEIS